MNTDEKNIARDDDATDAFKGFLVAAPFGLLCWVLIWWALA